MGSRGIAVFSLTSALDGGGWLMFRHGRFTPRKETRCTHCTEGSVDPRASLDVGGKFRPHRD
jgi:hypothetical protein